MTPAFCEDHSIYQPTYDGHDQVLADDERIFASEKGENNDFGE